MATFAPSGFLFLDKPTGMTSHDVVSHVRRALQTRAVGHAGTLDPFATGVLVLGVGQATRLLEFVMADEKEYEATLQLGATSTTEDPEGEITSSDVTVWPTLAAVEKVLPNFTGNIQQVPPRFSALKRDGVPNYVRARRGEVVDTPPRAVTIHSLEILEYAPPLLSLRVRCGSGTYIRSLGRDIGAALGTGAYLTQLRRTRSGRVAVDQCVTLETLQNSDHPEALLHPLLEAVTLPQQTVDDAIWNEFICGREVPVTTFPQESGVFLAVHTAGLAVVRQTNAGWHAGKVLESANVSR